jgi:hypothetical protein
MAYGIPADLVDENIAMAESMAIYRLRRFAKVIIKCFGELYLRAPNTEDTRKVFGDQHLKRVSRDTRHDEDFDHHYSFL